MKTLENKVAAVTGAASGLGRALAVELAGRGCALALADIDNDGLLQTAERVVIGGRKLTTRMLDVADREEVYGWAEEVVDAHGGVDILINNAGVVVGETLEDVTYEDFAWVMNINFWGVVYGTKAFLPHLRSRPEGHVVNISSINGMVPFPNNGPYNVSKYAVRAFSETLMQELRGSSVHVTSVHPGGIKTGIVRNMRFHKAADGRSSKDELADVFDRVARLDPDQAARIIVSGILKKRKRLLVGTDARIMDLITRLLPGLSLEATAHLSRSAGRKR